MSKVGESLIQGAVEALEIARRNGSDAEAETPISFDLSETPKSGIKTTEKTEIE